MRHRVELLCATQRRGRDVPVKSGLEHDAPLREALFDRPKRRVNIAERRAAIACHVPGRVESLTSIALMLREHYARDRLGAVHHDAASAHDPFILECYELKGSGRGQIESRKLWAGLQRA